MAREWREEYKGGIYHVIATGNNKVKYVKEAIKLNYTRKEIGTNINMSDAAVRNLISRVK